MKHTSLLAPLLALLALAAASCGKSGGDGGSASPTPTTTPVTFYEDVAPIVSENCVGCHATGGIAPFALVSYADALPQGPAMKGATQLRTMPPSTVDASGACNDYSGARWLSDAEIATIGAWVDGGMLEGNPANAPPPPPPLPTIAVPDKTLDIGVDYAPPVGADEYRCFLVDPTIAGTQFLVGYEVKPGNKQLVHHVVLFTLPTAAAQTSAEGLDTGEAGPGYTCFGGARVPSSIAVAWAPGTGATFFANGTGIALPAGRKMIVQIHYNTQAASGTDRTTIALDTAPSVTKPAFIAGVTQSSFTLAPGQTDAVITGTQSVFASGLLHAVYPHMHTHGRTMKLEVQRAGSSAWECVTDVPRWNFGWQQFHTFTTPLAVAAGDTLRVTCHYNTTGETAPVPSGENTNEEMCAFGTYATGP